MAKQFAGFTPQQTSVLLGKMGYTGSSDSKAMNEFLAASPAAAARLGKYTATAQQMLSGTPRTIAKPLAQSMPPATEGRAMAKGGVAGYAPGGDVAAGSTWDAATGTWKAPSASTPTTQATPTYTSTINPNPTEDTSLADQASTTAGTAAMMKASYTAPETLVAPAEVAKTAVTAEQIIDPNAAKLGGTTPTVTTATGGPAAKAVAPTSTQAITFDSLTSAAGAKTITDDAVAAKGTLSTDAQATAQTKSPTELAQLELDAAQIEQAIKVIPAAERELMAGEAISGSAVDMAKVSEAVQISAATADPTKSATVQGQLEGLMQQFEGGATPAWAAGAMRNATAMLAARGLGASSMAGQAVIQAAMESAMPIAQADAQTMASFQAQNLSNRQAATMLSAEQRAKFLGQDFDQAFQSKVMNAAKISDIANLNFTAEQQVALENARLAQSVDLTNLDARQGKVLADAAAMSQMDQANLNSRQQAAVLNSQSFLQMDMTNLGNRQQTEMFKSQSQLQALFTDQAAENAERQINAASKNQVTQFYDGISSNVSQFNATQSNAMKTFDTEQTNTIKKFNAEMDNQRQQWEGQNGLIIAQANAAWRQQVATTDTASQQAANMQTAEAVTGMTTAAINNMYQRERDLLSFVFQGGENAANRNVEVAIAKLTADEKAALEDNKGKGVLDAKLLDTFLSWL
jgi:hypothetical protein